MYNLTITLSLTTDQVIDTDDWLWEKLADIAAAVSQSARSSQAPVPVTGDDGSVIGSWTVILQPPPVCLYPSCGADSVRKVEGHPLCGEHASEFEDFISRP